MSTQIGAGHLTDAQRDAIKQASDVLCACDMDDVAATLRTLIAQAQPVAPVVDLTDSARLDWLEDMAVDLLSHESQNAEDDGKTFFTVIQHHMEKPHEREIGLGNTVRKAIDAARALATGNQS